MPPVTRSRAGSTASNASTAAIDRPVNAKVTKNAPKRNQKDATNLPGIEEEIEGRPKAPETSTHQSEDMDVDPPNDGTIKQEEGLFVEDPLNPADESSPLKGGGPSAESREDTKAEKDVPKLDITIQADDRTPTPPTPNDDVEDVLTAAQAFEKISISKDDNSTPIGWTRGPYGRELILLQNGPRNAAKFRIRKPKDVKSLIEMNEANDLTLNRPGEKKKNGKRVVKDILAFQGVAWQYPDNDPCPMLLLSPNKKGKTSPVMLVKVKMRIDDKIVTSWETRTTIRAIWGNDSTTLKDDLRIGDYVLIPKAQSIGSADAAILFTAVACEARHQEWRNKTREGTNKSPSPFPDVEGLRNTTQ